MKRSVSSLLRKPEDAHPEEETEETIEEKRRPGDQTADLGLIETGELPAFMQHDQQMTATYHGTLVHRMLSLLKLEKIREAGDTLSAVREEKKRMTAARIFLPVEAKEIREQPVADFFTSPLGARLLRSDTVRREWNFNLLLRREPQMIVQGVIDCAFREAEGWVLVDYKTDRTHDPSVLLNRYTAQLGWYARALRELTGEPVKEAWIYALTPGLALKVETP